MIEQDKKLPHFELTGSILNCCFEVMKELGPGFLENVYKNALLIAMKQIPIGLLVNFCRGKLEWKRLQSNQECIVDVEIVEELASF